MKVQELFEGKKTPTVDELINMFSTVNVDCKASGEQVVKLTDAEYYAHEIENIYEIPEAKADKLAKDMADEVKKRVADGSLPSEYGSKMKANKAVIK
jgi:hypothetical protein